VLFLILVERLTAVTSQLELKKFDRTVILIGVRLGPRERETEEAYRQRLGCEKQEPAQDRIVGLEFGF